MLVHKLLDFIGIYVRDFENPKLWYCFVILLHAVLAIKEVMLEKTYSILPFPFTVLAVTQNLKKLMHVRILLQILSQKRQFTE